MKSFFILFLLLPLGNSFAQEICNNGKDDDHDGLIDLQDPDCSCHITAQGNILLNPSFEDFAHCPAYNEDDREVADHWEYATRRSTNAYYRNLICHSDSLEFTFSYPYYYSLPSSHALIVIGQYASTIQPENELNKAYIAQCLQTPLKAGESYTLTFYAGRFQSLTNNSFSPRPFNVAVFGHNNCGAVPFGNPANHSGDVVLQIMRGGYF